MNGIVRKDLCLNDCRLMVKRNQSRIDTVNDRGVKCFKLSEFKYISFSSFETGLWRFSKNISLFVG